MTDEGEWIEWEGGQCPVDKRAKVVCVLGNGITMKAAMAKGRDWKRYDGVMRQWQIVKYRVVPA